MQHLEIAKQKENNEGNHVSAKIRPHPEPPTRFA
jgi:hypothetical protein